MCKENAFYSSAKCHKMRNYDVLMYLTPLVELQMWSPKPVPSQRDQLLGSLFILERMVYVWTLPWILHQDILCCKTLWTEWLVTHEQFDLTGLLRMLNESSSGFFFYKDLLYP